MRTPIKFFLSIAVLVGFGLFLAHLTGRHTFALIDTKGIVATRERNLMFTALALMMIIVLPVLTLTFAIAWRYRADNSKASYQPNWDHSLVAETIWWGIPCLIIGALGIITWTSTHQLDPRKPLASSQPPITIQVVALPWKWLFIYPQQHIATVNIVRFPSNSSVNFEITADAPMNSFSIPQLSGQIYAMPGMSTEINILADQNGSYRGQSANLSGEGFAGMNFIAQSSSTEDFARWVDTVKSGDTALTPTTYEVLAQPSENNAISTYATVKRNMYGYVLQKYAPTSGNMKMSLLTQ